ncbi:cytochrome P450 71A1-like [Phalaenopsis equestris]|uniref:cytochrome P450 71A1-like n=1 Tax=Phalaenopsis equestris TaxID=78828 RepID=UPI0009E47D8F|nr:cytochrome P450 71A1-like [Phalaenopsis equestris]
MLIIRLNTSELQASNFPEIMYPLLFTSCLLLLPLLLIFFRFPTGLSRRRRRRSYKLPPGPKPLPIVGNLLNLSRLPHISLLHLSKQYGPLMYLKLGQIPTIIASSKETAFEILKTQDLIFCTRPETIVFSKFSYGGLDMAFSPFNDHWKQLRKFFIADVFNPRKIQSFRRIREEEVGILMNTITRISSSRKLINFTDMALCLFNNIIYREVFGKRLSADGECGASPHHDMIMMAVSFMGGFTVSDFFPSFWWADFLTGSRMKLQRCFRMMDELYEKEIEERWVSIERLGRSPPQDILDVLLLCLVQKNPLLGFLLSRNEVKALLLDMFFGGTVTTALTTVWGMTELMRNKEAMKKAQDEVRQVVGNKGKVEEDDLKQLHYLKMVIKETLRLHPAAPLLGARECMKDTKINGYDIPAKTRVMVNISCMSRDPELWPDDAEIFKPERFENSSVDYKGNHIEFIPFGSGRRICPGFALGLAGVEIGLANVLYRFDWTLPEGMEGKDIDMREHFGIGVTKKTPLMLMANPVKFEGRI